MFLDNRQVKIIEEAIEDYNFIKEEIETFIDKNCNSEDINKEFNKIANFMERFKDVCIMDLNNYSGDYGYLDFEYKNINTCVSFDKETGAKFKVSSTFEIYDTEKLEFIIEDYITVEEYQKLIKTPKEKMLKDIVADLKWYESNNKEEEYKKCSDKIIKFLKEEF